MKTQFLLAERENNSQSTLLAFAGSQSAILIRVSGERSLLPHHVDLGICELDGRGAMTTSSQTRLQTPNFPIMTPVQYIRRLCTFVGLPTRITQIFQMAHVVVQTVVGPSESISSRFSQKVAVGHGSWYSLEASSLWAQTVCMAWATPSGQKIKHEG